ncbi:MAG: formate dehydrogenase accessory sulfurtransferase FdhD, partial [Acidimicrobiales bacterium]
PISSSGPFPLAEVLEWPSLLREAQRAFETTGGLHGAALISASKELLAAREDIGRHNAVDKVVGWALLEARLPLAEVGLVVSGRTSFEIIQKALRAGIGLVAAVSAASSLAAQLSEEEGLTLIGFVRNGSCTIYSHPERLDVG